MDKLTLCKKIAEIEGVKVSECKGQLIRMDLPFGTSLNAMLSLSKAKTLNDYKMAQDEYGKAYYDPTKDKTMLWDLFVKHEAEIDYKEGKIWIEFGDCKQKLALSIFDCLDKDTIPRAVLECIVEANNG